MDIQWYPGHMAKAKRLLGEKIKLIDVAVIVVDARAPFSTFNPDLPPLLSGRQFIVLLNKADLADEEKTSLWVKYFQKKYGSALSFSAKTSKKELLLSAINKAASATVKRYSDRGMRKTVRVLICGIPNVGKSAVINRLIGKSSAVTGDKPGVTKGLQWLKLSDTLELLDSPGLLWPKIESQNSAVNIALTGNIKQEIMDTVELAIKLIERLDNAAPGAVSARYSVPSGEARTVLEAICKKRGFLKKEGGLDIDRGSTTLLDEFKGGRLGRITLESPKSDA